MDIDLLKKTVKESKTINETLTKMGKNTSSGSYKLFNRYVKKHDIDISHFLTRQEIVNELYKSLRLKRNENKDIFIENSLSSSSIE